MADLADIQFDDGETDGMILEIDTATYAGALSDINMGNNSELDAPQTEMLKPTVVVDGRRKVR